MLSCAIVVQNFFTHLNIVKINATILLILLFKKQQIYNFTLPYISMPSFIIVRMNFFNSFQLSIIDIYSKTLMYFIYFVRQEASYHNVISNPALIIYSYLCNFLVLINRVWRKK